MMKRSTQKTDSVVEHSKSITSHGYDHYLVKQPNREEVDRLPIFSVDKQSELDLEKEVE